MSELSPELREIRDRLIQTLRGSKFILTDAEARRESYEVLSQRITDDTLTPLSDDEVRVLDGFLRATTDPQAYNRLEPEGRQLVDEVIAALEEEG